MRLRDIPMLAEIMPNDEWCDLSVAIIDLEISCLDVEQAEEDLQKARCKLAAANAVTEYKKSNTELDHDARNYDSNTESIANTGIRKDVRGAGGVSRRHRSQP